MFKNKDNNVQVENIEINELKLIEVYDMLFEVLPKLDSKKIVNYNKEVSAYSSTDSHGDFIAFLKPMFDIGLIGFYDESIQEDDTYKNLDLLSSSFKDEEFLKLFKNCNESELKKIENDLENKIIFVNLNSDNLFEDTLKYTEYEKLKEKKYYFPIFKVEINKNFKVPYIFNGDVLDRGCYSINCFLQALYILKQQEKLKSSEDLKENIFTFLLGNHEFMYLFFDRYYKVQGCFEPKIKNSEEYFKKVSNLLRENIDLFDFCKTIKNGEREFIYTHANLPEYEIIKDVKSIKDIFNGSKINSNNLKEISDFLEKIEKIEKEEGSVIEFEKLNNIFKNLLLLLIKEKGASSPKQTLESLKNLIGVLNNLCITRIEIEDEKLYTDEKKEIVEYYKNKNYINIVGHTNSEFLLEQDRLLFKKAKDFCIFTDMAASYACNKKGYSRPNFIELKEGKVTIYTDDEELKKDFNQIRSEEIENSSDIKDFLIDGWDSADLEVKGILSIATFNDTVLIKSSEYPSMYDSSTQGSTACKDFLIPDFNNPTSMKINEKAKEDEIIDSKKAEEKDKTKENTKKRRMHTF